MLGQGLAKLIVEHNGAAILKRHAVGAHHRRALRTAGGQENGAFVEHEPTAIGQISHQGAGGNLLPYFRFDLVEIDAVGLETLTAQHTHGAGDIGGGFYHREDFVHQVAAVDVGGGLGYRFLACTRGDKLGGLAALAEGGAERGLAKRNLQRTAHTAAKRILLTAGGNGLPFGAAVGLRRGKRFQHKAVCRFLKTILLIIVAEIINDYLVQQIAGRGNRILILARPCAPNEKVALGTREGNIKQIEVFNTAAQMLLLIIVSENGLPHPI